METPQNKFTLWVGALAVLGLTILIIIFSSLGGSSIPVPDDIARITGTDHVRGNPETQVVLIEYSDYQCPACAAFEQYVVKIIAEFGDHIVFAYRHFPLNIHANSKPAVRAVEAANIQGKFWEMHEMLFVNQKEWENEGDAKVIFTQYAAEIGINVEQFMSDYDSQELKDFADQTFETALELKLNHTPTFILNGEIIDDNPSSFDEFRALIRTTIENQPLGSVDEN